MRVRTAGRLSFAAPALLRSGPVAADLQTRVLAALGLNGAEVVGMEWVDNGPGWIGVELVDAQGKVLDQVQIEVRGAGVRARR